MYRARASLLILSFSLIALPAWGAGKVYRTTDKDGNVIYSDVPPADQGARETAEVEIRPSNTMDAPSGGTPGGRIPWIIEDADGDGEPDESDFVPYSQLMISAPSNDAPLRDNTGNVSVEIGIAPMLRGNHRLRLVLDGNTAGEDSSTFFTLTNVDRGTHTLVVEVIGEEGEVLQTSGASTFHMQRFHLPPKPAAPPKGASRPAGQ